MRYRAFNQTGASASAVSLALPDVSIREADRVKLIHAALEAGINTFELRSSDPEAALALGKGLSSVDRRLVNVGLRLTRPGDAAATASQIEIIADRTGLKWLDMAVLDAPDADPPPYDVIAAVQNQRALGRVRRLGIGGEGEVVQHYVRGGAFEILATRFNIHSGPVDRNRIKAAADRGMTVIACDRYPSRQSADLPAVLGWAGGLLGRLFTGGAKKELAGSRYAFLADIQGWSTEQLCIAYVLTEPAIATVQIDPLDLDSLKALAAVAERQLPNGLAAQIEMARFSNFQPERPVDNRRLRA